VGDSAHWRQRAFELFFLLVGLEQPGQFAPGFLGALQHFGRVVVDRVLGRQQLFVVLGEALDSRVGLGLAQPQATRVRRLISRLE